MFINTSIAFSQSFLGIRHVVISSGKNQISADSDTLRNVKISKFLKLLQILNGYHRSTSGFRPMSNHLTEKEVHYESLESIKNLAGLSPNQFEKKIPTAATPW